MKRKWLFIIVFALLIIFLLVYPLILIDTGDKLIKFSYNEDTSSLEDYSCYDESYFYNKDKDISIYGYDFKKFLFFHVIILEYKNGNVCDTEYLLEESYISNFLDDAEITYNSKNIDLTKLIKGKSAIVGNKRYFGNDYETFIEYVLDGDYGILYVFYVDDLLVIQVGLSDEGPKYIAYK